MIIRDDTVIPPEHDPNGNPIEKTPEQLQAEQEAKVMQQPTGTLRPDLEIFHGGLDESGAPTKVIFDPVSGTYFRISETDARIISCLSDNMSLGYFLEKVQANGINAEKGKLLEIINFLRQNNLMIPLYQVTDANVTKAVEARKKMRHQVLLSAYLMFRIPLFDPDNFLIRTLDIVRFIFNRWTLMFLRILAIIGYLCLIVNWSNFTKAFIKSISFQGLIYYSGAVIIIKIIHEFAHAYTARHYGCRVRKMGIAFIFFFPRLFSDLTDSWRLQDRWKRFMMDGAGIFSELIIGGIAAMVWANTGAGLTNTVAYYIFAVSIINTVLINGNPFIRYDGYYMLMDILNIDNLQKRGVDAVHNLWRKYLFGIPVQKDPARGWKYVILVIYGVCASLYRIFLYLSIILLVYFKFAKAIGIVCLVLEVYLLIWKPIVNEVKFLYMNRKRFDRKKAAISLSGIGVLILILVLPLPWNISAPCEIKSNETAVIYAPVNGYMVTALPESGAHVRKNDVLFRQENPFITLNERDAVIQERNNLLYLNKAKQSAVKRADISILEETLQNTRTRLNEMRRQMGLMETTSPIDGRFLLYDRNLMANKWLFRGEAVGEVFTPDSGRAVAYLPESELKYVKTGSPVTVLLNKDMRKYTGKIVAINPQAATLKSSPLLNIFGGPILGYVDENSNFVTLSTYYEIQVSFDEGQEPPAGRSGVVRMKKYASVAGNIGRTVLRVLQKELDF